MASFTDRAPTFNPYVQQQPVEAMVNVGLQMQQRYDQNLQKIQSTIENIAGLDVVRDVDKRYLESRLTNVGNKLTSFAAADFSQSEMANSVGGMVGIIGKDANVRNAVSSTFRYKKGLADKEQYTKEGKSGESNDWEFGTAANNWLNSEDLSKQFNGNYTPYTDYWANALKIVKEVLEDENITEDAFSFDENGNFIINDAILRKEVSGKSIEKIQTALMAGLSPNDWNQIQMDGRYAYSNVTPEKFQKDIETKHNDVVKHFNENKNAILSKISLTKNVKEKERLKESVAEMDRAIAKSTSEFEKMSKSIFSGDIESVKAKLFTNSFINNFSKAFSNTKIKETYHTNPLQVAQFNRDKEDQRHSEWATDHQFRQDRAKIEDSFRKGEISAKEIENENVILTNGLYGTPSPAQPQEGRPEPTLNSELELIESKKQNIVANNIALMERFPNLEANITPEQMAGAVKEYIKIHKPEEITPLIEKEIRAGLVMNIALEKYNNDSPDLTREVKDVIESNFKLRDQIDTKQKLSDNVKEDAENKYDIKKLVSPTLLYSVFEFEGGIEISGEELINFNVKFPEIKAALEIISTLEALPATSSNTYTINKMRKFLAKRSPLEVQLTQAKLKSGFSGKNTLDYDLNLKLSMFQKTSDEVSSTIKQKNAYIESELLKGLNMSYANTWAVPLSDKKPENPLAQTQKESFKTALQGIAAIAANPDDGGVGGIPNSPDVDSESILEYMDDLNTATFSIIDETDYNDKQYKLSLTKKAGKAPLVLNISEEIKNKVMGDRFDLNPEIRAIAPIEERISAFRRDSNGSTSSDGKVSTFSTAYLKGSNWFPNIKAYTVSGDVVKSGDSYMLELNIKDNINPENVKKLEGYQYNSNIPEMTLKRFLNTIDDISIYQILNGGKRPGAEDLKAINEKIKN